MNLAVLYVVMPQAETMQHIGMLFLLILGRPENLASRELEPRGLSRVYSVSAMIFFFLLFYRILMSSLWIVGDVSWERCW